MKKDLEQLIIEADKIEKLFHAVPMPIQYDGNPPLYIFDVPEFTVWITKIKYELTDIYTRTNDKFIYDLNNVNGVVNKFNGKHHNEKTEFIVLKTALQQILKDSYKYYPQETADNTEADSTSYIEFFKILLSADDAITFLDSEYENGNNYSESDLNEILGYLKETGLINGFYADNRFNFTGFTFKGKHFFDSVTTAIKREETMKNSENNTKKPKLFISHNSKDKPYVSALVDLFASIGLKTEHIFCSSLPGYDIPIDEDIFDYLRNHFLEYDLHIIMIHSKNYYESAVSLNEMGAAWALRNKHTSILLPGFDFSQMKGVFNGNSIGIKLDSDAYEVKDKLNQLKDSLVEEFGLDVPNNILWEKNRDLFIKSVLNEHSSSGLARVEVMKRPF